MWTVHPYPSGQVGFTSTPVIHHDKVGSSSVICCLASASGEEWSPRHSPRTRTQSPKQKVIRCIRRQELPSHFWEPHHGHQRAHISRMHFLTSPREPRQELRPCSILPSPPWAAAALPRGQANQQRMGEFTGGEAPCTGLPGPSAGQSPDLWPAQSTADLPRRPQAGTTQRSQPGHWTAPEPTPVIRPRAQAGDNGLEKPTNGIHALKSGFCAKCAT